MRKPGAPMKSMVAWIPASILCYLCLFTTAAAQRAVRVTPDIAHHIYRIYMRQDSTEKKCWWY